MTTPVLDPDIIEEAKAMMKAKFPTMVQYYLEDAETYLTSIREGIAENSVEKVVAPAHTIKSSSKQMGATLLAEVAKEMEHLARDQVNSGGNDTAVFKDLVTRIEKAIAETKDAFQAVTKT